MSNEFVSADPTTFVDRGFLTGRPVTIGGVRASLRPTRSGDSARVGMQFFFTETGKDGERRILSGFMHDGAWSDQMKPSDNLKGLVPESGADRPFIEKNSPLGLFNAALKAAGCPVALLTGNYAKLVGMEVILESKTLPSFKRAKSVDPDEQAAPKREFSTEVVSKIITLPADNAGYKGLTEKEMTAHLKEREDRRSARQAAAGADEEEAPATVAADEEEEPVAKPKRGKKAPVEDDEEEEEAAPAADSFGDDDEDEEEEEEGGGDAEALATKLILKVLKAEKKVKGSALLQKVHPHLASTDKKLTAAVLKLVQSPKFIAGVDGVTVKGNLVVLG